VYKIIVSQFEGMDSIKCGDFFDYLSDCKLLMRDSASWSQLVALVDAVVL